MPDGSIKKGRFSEAAFFYARSEAGLFFVGAGDFCIRSGAAARRGGDYQTIGSLPWLTRYSLAREKWWQPKKPR